MPTKINVVMGGPSAEYEVSMNSGAQVLEHIDKSKYSLRAVVIDKNKKFYYADVTDKIPNVHDYDKPNSGFSGPYHPADATVVWDGCAAAFLALHGEYGEDGTVQGYLDAIGVPYTGSGVYASAVAMNKITSQSLYILNGMTVPDYSIYGKNNPDVTVDGIIKKHGFPCFVKCPQSGSSRLMGRAKDRESLETLLKELSESADDILIETSISGTEFSCGVIDFPNGTTRALPPIEIRPANAETFFDYEAKYSKGGSEELVPAPQPEKLLNEIKEIAHKAHKILGCYGVSRTDMMYDGAKLYVLETNTLPGMTSTSLLPKAFAADANGGTYSELLDVLISSAIKRATAT